MLDDMKKNGFTLIEILLALAICTILILGIQGVYRQALLLWSRTEDDRPIYAEARFISELLRNELSSLYMPVVAEENGSDENGQDEVGEASKASFSLRTLPDGAIEVSFYALNSALEGSPCHGRVAKIGYSYNNGVLTRSEQFCAGEKIIGQKTTQIIAEGLANYKMDVCVKDENSQNIQWTNSYDSKDKPPKAVKISVSWESLREHRVIAFDQSVLIACQTNLSEPQ